MMETEPAKADEKLYPEKYEQLLKLAEEYVEEIQHEYMNPPMDKFINAVKEARKSFDQVKGNA